MSEAAGGVWASYAVSGLFFFGEFFMWVLAMSSKALGWVKEDGSWKGGGKNEDLAGRAIRPHLTTKNKK